MKSLLKRSKSGIINYFRKKVVLAVEEEKERCAKVADKYPRHGLARKIAKAIRGS